MMALRACALCAACSVLAVCGCEQKKQEPVEVVGKDATKEIKAVLGKEGGELRFEGGAKLEIPAGILREEVAVYFKQEEPSFDLAGKDFVGRAYRISPHLSFNPGFAKLHVPLDRQLPGMPEDVELKLYYFGKKVAKGPSGDSFVHEWIPVPVQKFIGFSQDQKQLIFAIFETISDRTTKAPYGLLQAAYNMR
ncbi:MAG: hypothetical protein JXR96_19970 [Deltaproteobacteria bacterium]|nr:hypothetical protein [Deltaproteobacteria bacterium]